MMAPRAERAARAMAHLPEHDPALASLALWCDVIDSGDTTHTNSDTIHIGADFQTYVLREQIGLLGHHILHIALRHSARMARMQQRFGAAFRVDLFNLAADALVNTVLEQGGHALPRPAVTLQSLNTQVPLGDGDVAQWDVERLYVQLDALSGAAAAQLEDYAKEIQFTLDITPDGTTDSSQKDDEWQGHLQRALQGPGGSGRGIGGVLGRFGDLPRSDTPWDVILRRLVARAVQYTPRRTYARPRTGWIAAAALADAQKTPAPVFEPGYMRNQRRARIVIGVDSSGSVSDGVLALFGGEIAAIARRSDAELHVLWFDDVVYDHQCLTAPDIVNALRAQSVRRDGGTSFGDVLAQASALDPSVVILLSDLDGPMGAPPGVPVIWASPDPDPPQPGFGQVVSLAR